jgi:ubiquinone/menaquinone biosynthesis C-methylase UbiE
MPHAEKAYLPAAGHDWALPLYDPVTRLLGGDKLRRELVRQAALESHHRVLDIGCGTGTLVTEIKRVHPSVEVTGLDPDPKALARARRKTERAGVAIRFEQGFAGKLPFPDASFDRVFSSFMFHHLPADEREKMLREVRRVLAPGGSLHLADFARPGQHSHGLLAHLLHSSRHLADNSDERILALMQQAGFAPASKVADGAMLLGLLHISYYRAGVSGK